MALETSLSSNKQRPRPFKCFVFDDTFVISAFQSTVLSQVDRSLCARLKVVDGLEVELLRRVPHRERGADDRRLGEAVGADPERLVDEGRVLRDGDGSGISATGSGKVSCAAGTQVVL